MKYLVIENQGLLELGALSLMGASTKRGDSSKIGMFGSGNKYALAYFLRYRYDIHIFIGQKEVKLQLKKEQFREHTFDVIWVNGEKTSITTEMGQEWTLWQALRELYSNAVDEGIVTFGIDDIAPSFTEVGSKETTSILVEASPEVEQFMFNLNDYLALEKEVLYENSLGKIYRKHSAKACIYRKGIKCYDTDMDSIYDYDFNSIDITEDREVRYSWDVYRKIGELLYECDNVNIIRNVLYNLSNGKNYLEHKVDSELGTIWTEMSSAWVEAVEEKNICPKSLGGYVEEKERPKTLFLPDGIYNTLVARTGSKNQPANFKVTTRGQAFMIVEELPQLNDYMLKEVMKFLTECKFSIPYVITVVDFKDKDVYGGIGDEEILLSVKAFDHGKDWVLNVIIEEYIHLKHNAPDESRKFQDAAIAELITYMKVINTYSL